MIAEEIRSIINSHEIPVNVTFSGKRIHFLRKLFFKLSTENESRNCKLQRETIPNSVDVTRIENNEF